MTMPVYEFLRQTEGFEPVIVGLTSAWPVLEAAGLPHFAFRDLIRDGDDSALAWGEKLAQEHHNPDSGIPLEETVAYLGLCYDDLERRLGADRAAELLRASGRHAFLPLGPIRRLFDMVQPQVVVTTNSPKSERASVLVARERGIPSLSMVDLFGAGEMYTLCADRITVLCSITRDALVASGVDVRAIRVTGNPAFDSLVPYVAPADPQWTARHLSALPGPYVLWADQHAFLTSTTRRLHFRSEEETYQDLSHLHRACRIHGATLLIRPHPCQSALVHQRWLEDHPDCGAGLVADLPLYPLLQSVDAVLTFTSTVGLESVLLNRPTMTINSEPGSSDLPLADFGLSLAAVGMGDVPDKLGRLLFDPELHDRLETASRELVPDGRAAQRVGTLIGELASLQPEPRC